MLEMFLSERTSEGVRLVWSLSDETYAREYRIYRTRPGEPPVTPVIVVPASGSGHYEVTDRDALNREEYSYTLTVVDRGGEEKLLGTSRVGSLSPAKLDLWQNFPNPFDRATRIGFTLDKPGHVRLEIFDAKGRLVKVLMDEHAGPGRIDRLWMGRDGNGCPVAAGMYFYRLTFGGKVFSKKMVLMK